MSDPADTSKQPPTSPPEGRLPDEWRRRYSEASRMDDLVASGFFDDPDEDDAEIEPPKPLGPT